MATYDIHRYIVSEMLDKCQASIENAVTGGTEVVVVISYGNACGDNKVGIMTTLISISNVLKKHYAYHTSLFDITAT